MKKSAKILVILLSVALMLGMMAFAVSANDTAAYGYTSGGQSASSDDLATAFAGSDDATVTLLKDIEISASLVIPNGATFNLGGKKITNTATTPVFDLTAGAATITGEGQIVTTGSVMKSTTSGGNLIGTGNGIDIDSTTDVLFQNAGGTLTIEKCDIYTNNHSANYTFELNASSLTITDSVIKIDDPTDTSTGYLFKLGRGEKHYPEVNITRTKIESTGQFFQIHLSGGSAHVTVDDCKLDFTKSNGTNTNHTVGKIAGGYPNVYYTVKNSTLVSNNSIATTDGRGNLYIEIDNSDVTVKNVGYVLFRGKGNVVTIKNESSIYNGKDSSLKLYNDWAVDNATISIDNGVRLNAPIPADMNGTTVTYTGGSRSYYRTFDEDACSYVVGSAESIGELYASVNNTADPIPGYITSYDKLIDYLLKYVTSNDVLTLEKDVTVTGNHLFIINDRTLTINLNGKTLDFGTTTSRFILGDGASANNAAGLYIKSSAAGAKIFMPSDASQPLVTSVSKNKTFDYQGENIYFEGPRFFSVVSYGWNSAGGTFTINGGEFKQTGASTFFLNDGNNGAGRPNSATVTINGITLRGEAVSGSSRSYLVTVQRNTNSSVIDAFTFNDCDISYENTANSYVVNAWGSGTSAKNVGKITFNGCTLNVNMKLVGGLGKIVIGEGTTFVPTADLTINAYSADDISNVAIDDTKKVGVWYAEGIVGAIAGDNLYKAVKPADASTYSYYEPNGDLIANDANTYYVNDAAPVYAGADHNEYLTVTLKFNGWTKTETGKYTANYEVVNKKVSTWVSLTLYTEIGVNLYIDAATYAALDKDASAAFVDNGDGYYKSTVTVDANKTFSGPQFTLVFTENTVVGEKTTGTVKTIPVALYASEIINGEYSAAEKDLAYYMLNYIRAAYQYFNNVGTVSDEEKAVIAKLGYKLEDYDNNFTNLMNALFDDYNGLYQIANVQDAQQSEYTGDELNLRIGVDLSSTPKFKFTKLDSNISYVTINGTKIGSDGWYSVGNVYNLDNVLTIKTYDADGNVLTEGQWCYANYNYNTQNNIGSTTPSSLKAIANALYQYILAAQAYKDSISNN